MEGNERGTGIGLGLLIGGAIGLALGFLYAPRPGRETRAMFREKAEEVVDRAEKIVEEARERGRKIVEDARGKAEVGGRNGYREEVVPLNKQED